MNAGWQCAVKKTASNRLKNVGPNKLNNVYRTNLPMQTSTPDQQPQADEPISPPLLSLLAGLALERFSPELLNRLPEEEQDRIRRGDPKVWADLIAREPELFREPIMSEMEDLAFEHLLRRKPSEDSAGPPSSDASSPSVACPKPRLRP